MSLLTERVLIEGEHPDYVAFHPLTDAPRQPAVMIKTTSLSRNMSQSRSWRLRFTRHGLTGTWARPCKRVSPTRRCTTFVERASAARPPSASQAPRFIMASSDFRHVGLPHLLEYDRWARVTDDDRRSWESMLCSFT